MQIELSSHQWMQQIWAAFYLTSAKHKTAIRESDIGKSHAHLNSTDQITWYLQLSLVLLFSFLFISSVIVWLMYWPALRRTPALGGMELPFSLLINDESFSDLLLTELLSKESKCYIKMYFAFILLVTTFYCPNLANMYLYHLNHLWISNKCYISQMLWKNNNSAVKSSEVCICSLHKKRVCVTVRLSVCIWWVWSCHTIDKLETLDFKRCSTISSLPLCCIHIIFTVCCMSN